MVDRQFDGPTRTLVQHHERGAHRKPVVARLQAIHQRYYAPPRSPAPVHHLRVPRSLHAAEFIDALFYPFNDFMEQHSQLFMLL